MEEVEVDRHLLGMAAIVGKLFLVVHFGEGEYPFLGDASERVVVFSSLLDPGLFELFVVQEKLYVWFVLCDGLFLVNGTGCPFGLGLSDLVDQGRPEKCLAHQ